MNRRGQIFVYCLMIISVLVLPRRVFCYDTYVAHSNIAQKAGVLFNKNNEQKLTVEQISWIMQGAEEEDVPTRWLNHFYDPVHNIGLKGAQLSAKDWSISPKAQTQFSLGDQSWQRALNDLKNGNEKLAYIGLGHTIHLISDMTVPAHTRDDIHVIGDSYEQFVKNNWDKLYPQFEFRIKYADNTDESSVFDLLANYSNNNFFSDDTIVNPNFVSTYTSKIVILEESGIMRKFVLNTRDDIKLCRDSTIKKWQNTFGDEYKFSNCTIGSNLVLTDYAIHLIPKAIGYSAGLIKLFQDEAKKEKTEELPILRTGLRGYADQAVATVMMAAYEMMNYVKSKFNPAPQVAVGETGKKEVIEKGFSASLGVTNVSAPAELPVNQMKKTVPSNIVPTRIASSPAAPRNDKPPTEVLKEVRHDKPLPPTEILKQVQDDNAHGGGSSPYTAPPIITPPTSTPSTSTTPTPTSTPPAPTSTPSTTPVQNPPPAPILDEIFDDIIFTTSSEADIYGICSTDTVKITLNPFFSEPYAVASNSIWIYTASLNSGHNSFSFFALDNQNTTSTASSSAHIVRDNDPPPTPLITATDQSSASSTIISIALASVDALSPVTYFDLYFAVFIPTSSPTSTPDWQPLATSTVSTTIDFIGTRGQSYVFKTRAWDILGNTSPWSDEAVSSTPMRLDWSKQIVINEIAWGGTVNDATGRADEWVELYNNTDQDINIKGWEIFVTTSSRKIFFSTSTDRIISAHGYFLLERTDDNAVQNIAADYIFSLASGLLNAGEHLKLKNAEGEIVDEIDCSSGWFAGSVSSSPYATMSRINPLAPGNDKNNWRTSRGPWFTARAHDNTQFIYGSPREANKELKILTGTQSETELTLNKTEGPYFLNNFTLPATGTLRLEAGTEIYLPAYGYFYVNGNMESLGTDSEPVVFSPIPSSTMWANIIFSSATATLTHTNFLRGNMEPLVRNNGALYMVSSSVSLDYCTIWNSRKPGNSINSINSFLTVKNSSIGADEKMVNNNIPGVNTTGIKAKGGQLVLENTLFTNLIIGVNGGSVNDNLPQLSVTDMPPENFVNVDYPWQPSNWLDLVIPPVAPIVAAMPEALMVDSATSSPTITPDITELPTSAAEFQTPEETSSSTESMVEITTTTIIE